MNSGRPFSKWFPLFLIWTLVFLAYSNIYNNGFLFDDEFLIQKNMNLREWPGLLRAFQSFSTGGSGGVDLFYRPLQSVFYTFIFQFFGLETWAFHLPGLMLHLGNVSLVWLIGLRLGLKPKTAGILTAIWAVHPIHTEAVTYMSAIADTGYTFFLLCGSLLYLNWLQKSESRTSLILSALCFIPAVLFKEPSVVLPGLLLAMALGYSDQLKIPSTKKWLSLLPSAFLAMSYFVVRRFALPTDFYKTSNIYTENIEYRIYTALATLPKYIELLIAPHDLHMERSFPVYTSLLYADPFLGFLIFAIFLVGLFMAFKRSKSSAKWGILFTGLLWAAMAQSPHTGILLPVNSFFLEHWMYLPSIGLLWVLGAFLDSCSEPTASKLKYPLHFRRCRLRALVTVYDGWN